MSWLPKKKVVVPVDFSEASFRAVKVARSLVEDTDGLHVLHIIPSVHLSHPDLIIDQSVDDMRLEKTKELLRSHLSGFEFEQAHFEVFVGDPGNEIVDFAKQSGADLIVMPSHGRTGLSRLVIGSVAERVIRHAHCPVLVLRGE